MNKINTSLEQSEKLVELGIDISTADMYYPNRVGMENCSYALPIEWKLGLPLLSQETPTWSLTALLDILPLEIELLKQSDGNIKYYYMEYTTKETYFASKRYTNPIDAAFEIIVWLKQEKYI